MAPNTKNDEGYQFTRRKSTWKPNFAQIGGFLYFWWPFWIQNGHHSKPTSDIIRNIIIYLETKFRPNRRIFLLWWPFWIQNGHYSQSKWSPYGAACLTSCKYPFPLKSFNFLIFSNLFWFYICGHFEMAAILKWRPFWNFKNKEHNFEWWSIFVSSFKRIRCTEWIQHFLHLSYHGKGRHFNFFNPLHAVTHYRGYSCKVSWSLMEGIQKFLTSLFFVSMATAAKFVHPIPIIFGLSRSTRCGCCSYQVSSISVRRVICYGLFCVFSIF